MTVSILGGVLAAGLATLTIAGRGLYLGGDLSFPGGYSPLAAFSWQGMRPWLSYGGEAGGLFRHQFTFIHSVLVEIGMPLDAAQLAICAVLVGVAAGISTFAFFIISERGLLSIILGSAIVSNIPAAFLLTPFTHFMIAGTPVTFAIVLLYLSVHSARHAYVLSFCAGLLASGFLFTPPTALLGSGVGVIVGLCWLFGQSGLDHVRIMQALGRAIIATAVFLVSASWWLIPQVVAFLASSSADLGSPDEVLDRARWMTRNASALNTFSGLHNVWLGGEFGYNKSFVLADLPGSRIITFLFVAIPIGLLMWRRLVEPVLCTGLFASLALVWIIALGPRGPLEFFYANAGVWSPIIATFREPFSKVLGVQMMLSCLLWALALSSQGRRTKAFVLRPARALAQSAIALYAVATSAAMYLSIRTDYSQAYGGVHVPVESRLMALSDLGAQSRQGAALFVPSATFVYGGQSWGAYSVKNEAFQFGIPGALAAGPGGHAGNAGLGSQLKMLTNASAAGDVRSVSRLLDRWHVNLLVLRRDLTTNIDSSDVASMETTFSRLDQFEPIQDVGLWKAWRRKVPTSLLQRVSRVVTVPAADEFSASASLPLSVPPNTPILSENEFIPSHWGFRKVGTVTYKSPASLQARIISDTRYRYLISQDGTGQASILARIPARSGDALLVDGVPRGEGEEVTVSANSRIESLSYTSIPRGDSIGVLLALDEGEVLCDKNSRCMNPRWVEFSGKPTALMIATNGVRAGATFFDVEGRKIPARRLQYLTSGLNWPAPKPIRCSRNAKADEVFTMAFRDWCADADQPATGGADSQKPRLKVDQRPYYPPDLFIGNVNVWVHPDWTANATPQDDTSASSLFGPEVDGQGGGIAFWRGINESVTLGGQPPVSIDGWAMGWFGDLGNDPVELDVAASLWRQTLVCYSALVLLLMGLGCVVLVRVGHK